MPWRIKSYSSSKATALCRELGLHSIVAEVLVARGVDTLQEARGFIDPSLENNWSNPEDIDGLAQIATRLEEALRSNKRICVFGDYDADGITAAAIMYNTLTALGRAPDVVLPLRGSEGYGLSEPALERIYALEPHVVLTVDCGVSGAREVAALVANGIEVLITDHHEGSGAVPEGVPLADPKLNPMSPAVILAGAGVALKLSALLGARMGMPELWKSQLDLAALGTIGDCMPLIAENRALVAAGVKSINTAPRPSIAAALELSDSAQKTVSAQSLAFGLIPRLNAAGRVSDPMISFDMLCASSPERAMQLAVKLEALNTERKNIEARLYQKAREQIEPLSAKKRSVVVGGEDWHTGVGGIVASRLVREYGVIAVVFSFEGDEAVGSGRSVGTIDLHAVVGKLSDMLLRFGGHQGAVGLTIEARRMNEFAERLEELLQQAEPAQFEQFQEADCRIELNRLSLEAVQEFSLLEPCGQDNPEPIFVSTNLLIKSKKAIGAQKQHLSFEVSDGVRELPAVWFNPPYQSLDEVPDRGDVVYRVNIDTWRGHSKVKLMVMDVVTAGSLANGGQSSDHVQSLRDTLDGVLQENDTDSLNDFLADTLSGGPVTLRASQRKCLETLDLGQSTLGIMATGRGKSLIFQIHATKLALKKHSPSLFIYPLKSLINDQEYYLSGMISSLGLSCASLTGTTQPQERARIAEGVRSGSIAMVLTTPEYVMAHAQERSFWQQFAFVVVDEAHHIASSSESFRPNYTRLKLLQDMMSQAVFLGLSATSDKQVTNAIAENLATQHIVVDTSKRPNLLVQDMRDTPSRDVELARIVENSTKSLVYAASRVASIELCKLLRKQLAGKAPSIAFYHAALTTEDRAKVEEAFRNGELSCVVATSAFGEGVNIPNIRDVILYDLPYSIIDFNQMAGRAGRDGQEAFVHILAQRADAERLIEHLQSEAAAGTDLGGIEDSTAAHEQSALIQQLKLFADWLFTESPHGLSSVIQRPLTPLEERAW